MNNRFLPQAAPGIENLRPYVPGKPLSELEREFARAGVGQKVGGDFGPIDIEGGAVLEEPAHVHGGFAGDFFRPVVRELVAK
mgnify:CR=1 FL=1